MGERGVESEKREALGCGAVLNGNEFPFIKIKAIDSGEGEFALRVEPAKCVRLEIEDGDAASIVRHEKESLIAGESGRLRGDELTVIEAFQGGGVEEDPVEGAVVIGEEKVAGGRDGEIAESGVGRAIDLAKEFSGGESVAKKNGFALGGFGDAGKFSDANGGSPEKVMGAVDLDCEKGEIGGRSGECADVAIGSRGKDLLAENGGEE